MRALVPPRLSEKRQDLLLSCGIIAGFYAVALFAGVGERLRTKEDSLMKTALRTGAGALAGQVVLILLGILSREAAADSTFVYAVQISATVQSSPAQIHLHWQPDPYGADSYTIYRKAKTGTDWGSPIVTLSGSATDFTDTQVSAGSAYEYQIVKAASLGYTGYGYIYSGINSPLTENRGTIILLVERNASAPLSGELSRLQSDLLGDGWQVVSHYVSSNDSPASVRSLVFGDYYADPANVSTVFLFGHVPVLESGDLAYDGHGLRPMPADAFYGDVNDDWPTDPASSPSFLPSDVTLMVGRVDFANMPGARAPTLFPSETELLRNYLNKDHNWRHKLLNVPRLALMANRVGDDGGQAEAASGYRNFEPMVGPGNTIEVNVEDTAPVEQRWISVVTNGSYLWSYACGGGDGTEIGWLGTNQPYNAVYSTDIVGQDAHAVFTMFFGSWLGEWDLADNIMRSVLATPTMGLTACMAGRPHWFLHHMALGEPIGYSTRLSMNNSTLYQNQSNALTRAVYVALMGDPTLRLDPVAPPANLSASTGSAGVNLSWAASPDQVAGYHIYRAATPAGPFSRVTTSLVAGTSFNDNTATAGTYTWMVRAVKLQTTPSGSYFNPSQGVFTTGTDGGTTSIALTVAVVSNGLSLAWNSNPGTTYRVQAKSGLAGPNWSDVSGTITATNSLAVWTDTSIASTPMRFYRIASP